MMATGDRGCASWRNSAGGSAIGGCEPPFFTIEQARSILAHWVDDYDTYRSLVDDG